MESFASRARLPLMSKTIKNQWFSMILPCPRCPKNDETQSRGEAAPGLSAQLPDDIKIGPILLPKWHQNWSQNGVRNGLKFALVSGLVLVPKLAPKMAPKWLQNWSQNGVSCPDVLLEPQEGPKWTQHGSGSPKMDPKWLQNGSKMAPKCDAGARNGHQNGANTSPRAAPRRFGSPEWSQHASKMGRQGQ